MNPLEATFYVAGILGVLGVAPTIVWVGKKIARANRADTEVATKKAVDAALSTELALALQPFDARMGRIEDQFGPNGGGMREAINNVAADVRVVKEHVGGITTRFEDHLDQSREDRGRLTQVERALLRLRS